MDTPASLLERLRQPGQPQAWDRLVELYTPLLYRWARRAGLQPQDAADIVQDVFTILVRKLPDFVYDKQRSFRAWLRTLLLNRWRDGRRRAAVRPAEVSHAYLDGLPARASDDLFEEAEYRRELVGRALRLIRPEFREPTWKAWMEHGQAGRPAAEVARELELSEGAVYAAKCRVLRRLRRELEGLLD
ncbi:MAG TPA: sigma-70 family RNA polymerase sigma factor [Gemmataceae bacterium]|nr:sigma-70 family RNA polymerase sigma factor [Gemmataceae bacterium]